jgi:O-antigen/teichoic acid export membrane protein
MMAVLYFVVVRKMGAHGQLLGDVIANSVAAIILIGLMFKERFSWQLNWDHLRVSLAYSLPLIPHLVSGWALNAIDRILLESGVALSDLGIYNLAYQLGMAMSILVFSINQAWVPYYYNLMKREKNPELVINRVVVFYAAGVGGICLLGALFSPELVRWVAPARYQGAERFVPPILFAYLLQGFYYFASAPIFYYKHTKLIPLVTLVGATVNILLNLWWIPIAGAMGSAWATTIAYGLVLLLAYFMGRQYQRLELPLLNLSILISLIFTGVLISTTTFGFVDQSINILSFIKLSVLFVYGIFVLGWIVLPVARSLPLSVPD